MSNLIAKTKYAEYLDREIRAMIWGMNNRDLLKIRNYIAKEILRNEWPYYIQDILRKLEEKENEN